MKKYFLLILLSLGISVIHPSSYAVTYPVSTPPFETNGGLYNTYFSNMYTAPCASGLALVGFGSTGVLQCLTVSTATTAGFTGSLIGTEFYIPKYTAAGTGITDSQLFDGGTTVSIGTGVGALPVTNGIRLNVKDGDLEVNNLTIGLGNKNTPGNTALGQDALFNAIAGGNTALGKGALSTLTAGINNIGIGLNAEVFSSVGFNQLNIGNWIYGSNGNIGIGNPTPGAKLDILGTVKIVDGSEGNGKVLVSDASGLASWQGFVSGSTATGIISGAGTAHYLSKFGIGGTGIYPSQLFESGANIGLGTTNPAAKLDVIGNIKITDGTQGLNKVLTSDALGLASWQIFVAGTAYATGIIIPPGSNNYLAKFDSTGSGIVASVVYENLATGNIGIGTNTPGVRFEIDSGVAGTSGLRFTRLNTLSPLITSNMVSIGINSLGDVLPISPVSNIAVYTALNPATPPTPNPNSANTLISYDFNHYFAIDTKQSFVISKGNFSSSGNDAPNTHGDYAPFVSENAISSNCNSTGTNPYSPSDCEIDKDQFGNYATPDNTFTMTVKGENGGDNYGYQLTLASRGDAPLFTRTGRFASGSLGSTGGLFLPDGVTPTFWSKILAFPANHSEYLYINTGYNSQLLPQAGGGQVAIGTTFPNSRFEIWTGSSTAPLMHFRGNGNIALGEYALNTPIGTSVNTLYSKNTALGYAAGSGMDTGSNNIYLGTETRAQNGASSNTLNIVNTIFGNSLPITFGGTSGNIGISTNNPTYRLSVNGTIHAADSAFSASGNLMVGDQASLYDINQNNTLGIFGGQNSDRLTLRLGNRTDQYIATNGNGGFGIDRTPHPLYKLAVSRDILLTTGSLITTGDTGLYNESYLGGWNMTDTDWIRSVNSKNIWIGNGVLGSDGGLQIGYSELESPSVGGAIIQNSVAIGSNSISSPNVKLSILRTVANTGAIQIRDGQELNGRVLMSDANGIGTWRDAGSSSIDWHVTGNNLINQSTDFIGTTDSAALIFKTKNIERLRITPSGSFGIGTSTPGAYQLNNSGTTYFADDIDIEPTRFIRFQNTSVLNSKSGISWSNNSVVGSGLTSLYVNKTAIAKNSLIAVMDSPNNFDDEFVWIHDRSRPSFDSTPMRLSARTGSYYNGVMTIQSPYSGGYKQVGFNTIPSSFGSGTPRVSIDGKIRITDFSEGAGKVLVSDANGIGTWAELGANSGSLGFWHTIGNTGTTIHGNFLGTTNPVDFVVKANSQEKIYVEHNTSNLRIGGDMMLGRGVGNIAGNTVLGVLALGSNIVGIENTAIGYRSLNATRGSYNTAVGYDTLLKNTTGNNNTALGNGVLVNNTTGVANTAIGNNALFNHNGGNSNNTAIGNQALYITRSRNSIAFGSQAGSGITSGNTNIMIGKGVQPRLPTLNLQLNIGNWIYGNNGNIGIGTNTPSTRLEIDGNSIFEDTIRINGGSPGAGKVLTSDATGNASWNDLYITVTGGTTNYLTRWTSPASLGTGSLYDNGNVGIKTNLPTQKLDIVGNLSVPGLNGFSIYDYQGTDSNWRIGTSNNPGITRSLVTNWTQYAIVYNNNYYGFSVGANGGDSSFEVSSAADGYRAFFRGNVGFGTASASQKIDIIGKIRIEDGTEASGAILTSDSIGAASWILPPVVPQTEWIYTKSAIQNYTSTALTPIASLTTTSLAANTSSGFYEFELKGRYTSNQIANGIALGLSASCPGNMNDVIALVDTEMGSGTSHADGFFSNGGFVTSPGVKVVNTGYYFITKGTFKLSANCTISPQFATEVAGRSVSILPGAYLKIRLIEREAGGGNL